MQRAAKGDLLFTSEQAEVIGPKVLAQIQQKVLEKPLPPLAGIKSRATF